MKGKKLFAEIKKGLVETVEDIFTMDVALTDEDEVLAYTHSSADVDTINYLNRNMQSRPKDVIDFHHRMILISRLNKGAFLLMLDEIT